jgi:Ni/Co efflux regulator RcnB
MKTKQMSLTLLCLLLFAAMGNSQLVAQSQSDSERHQNILRSFWDGRGASISTEALLLDPEFRAVLSVSAERYQEIQAIVRNAVGRVSDDPEYRKLTQEIEEANRVVLGLGPFDVMPPTPAILRHNLNEKQLEALNRSRELGERRGLMQREFTLGASQRHIAAFEEALTPEIKEKIQEAWLAAMGETAMFSPSVFEVLNLTDSQRQQMERIKEELEPALEKHLAIYGNNAAMILKRVNTALREPGVQRSIADVGLNTFMRALQDEPEHKKLLDESYASSKAFAELFRTRMLDILTDEQRRRLQELTDNPPPHARLLIQRLRREQWGQHEEGDSERAAAGVRDIWIPGAGSWRPGDPVPGVYRRDGDTRESFPRSTD